MGSGGWALLFAALVVCITLAEAILLELGATFFSGGYNHPSLDTPAQVIGFFAASLAVDAFLVLAIWLVALPLLRRFSASLLSCFVLLAIASLAVAGVFDLLRYRFFAVVGRGASLGNLVELGAGEAPAMATEAALQLEGMIVFGLLALAGLFLVFWALRRASLRWPSASQRLDPAPRLSLVAWGCFLAALLAAVVFIVPGEGAARIQQGLFAKPSALLWGQARPGGHRRRPRRLRVVVPPGRPRPLRRRPPSLWRSTCPPTSATKTVWLAITLPISNPSWHTARRCQAKGPSATFSSSFSKAFAPTCWVPAKTARRSRLS